MRVLEGRGMFSRRFIVIVILVFSFIFSLTLFVGNKQQYTKLSFKFYHEFSNKVVTEDRFVLLKGSYTEDAEKIVEEILLGPHSIFNKKLVNYGLTYDSFIIRDGVAFLDLPLEFLHDSDDNKNSKEDVIELIKANILNNIKKIKSVIVTVDGYILNNGPYPGELPQGI